jgi:hypothetical protein
MPIGNLLGYKITEVDKKLMDVYGDYIHQNNGSQKWPCSLNGLLLEWLCIHNYDAQVSSPSLMNKAEGHPGTRRRPEVSNLDLSPTIDSFHSLA